MKKIIKEGHKLERFTLPRAEAVKFMEERNEPYKVELIRDLPEDAEISFYDQGGFVDLCAGPHLMSTKNIKAYKLISSSMAYWRGDSDRAQLQRIYGTAFAKKEELAAFDIWSIWKISNAATTISWAVRWSCLPRLT